MQKYLNRGIKSQEVNSGLGWQQAPESRGQRGLEGAASSGSVNSAPRSETTCPASLALPVKWAVIAGRLVICS